MVDLLTPRMGLTKPAVGDPAGVNQWGNKINNDFEIIDAKTVLIENNLAEFSTNETKKTAARASIGAMATGIVVSTLDTNAVGNGVNNDTVYINQLAARQDVYRINLAQGKFLIDNTYNNLRGKLFNGPGILVKYDDTELYQVNSYADGRTFIEGREYAAPWFAKLGPTTIAKVACSGDSTTEYFPGYLYSPSKIIEEMGKDAGFNIVATNLGHSGKNTDDWLNIYLPADIAFFQTPGNKPDRYQIRWGLNDFFAPASLTADQTINNIRAGLALFRSHFPFASDDPDVGGVVIDLFMPNAHSHGGGCEIRMEEIYGGLRKAARDYQAVFVDTYAYARDARFCGTKWLDAFYRHANEAGNLMLGCLYYDLLIPGSMKFRSATRFLNPLSTAPGGAVRNGTEQPSAFSIGASFYRGSAPSDGSLYTLKVADSPTLQISAGMTAETEIQMRHATDAGPNTDLTMDWSNWVKIYNLDKARTQTTPAVTAETGVITTSSAFLRYKKLGRICKCVCIASVSDNGTGADKLRVAAPFEADSTVSFIYYGNGQLNNSVPIQVYIQGSKNYFEIVLTNNAYPVPSGGTINFSIEFETVS